MKLSSFYPGKFINDYGYKYFLPEKINHEWLIDSPEIQLLYKNPVIDASGAEQILNVFKPTAHQFIREFMQYDLLREITGMKRNRLFVFSPYIDIF